MSDKIYKICLEDYSCPGFVSGVKSYFGTLEKIEYFINKLEKTEEHSSTVKAFYEYIAGNAEAAHSTSCGKRRLIKPAVLLESASVTLPQTRWKFINAFGCPYNMRVDSARVNMLLVKQGDNYSRCIQAETLNLAYQTDYEKDEWYICNRDFWGHPEMMEVTHCDRGDLVKNRLYVIDKRFNSEAETRSSFLTEPINLNKFCEDIFGDG